MTDKTKDSKESESTVPPSQENLEGGDQDTIAPEQLVEALKQQAMHIEGGEEAIVIASAQVPTADSEVLPSDYADVPQMAEDISDQHKEQFKKLAESSKDDKSEEEIKRESARKDQETAKKEIEEQDKRGAEADKKAAADLKKEADKKK